MIKLGKKFDSKTNLVFILDKKFSAKDFGIEEKLPIIIQNGIDSFLKSKDDFDYLKLGEQSIFFVKVSFNSW